MRPRDPKQWYFSAYIFVLAFLCIGPFALPLLWTNPRLGAAKKVIITVIVIILSSYITLILIRSIQSINSYCQQMLKLSQYR